MYYNLTILYKGILSTHQLLTMNYPCTQCNYTSKRKYNLERHIALVHNLITMGSTNDSTNSTNSLQKTQEDRELTTINSQQSQPVVQTTMCTKCKRDFSNEFSRKRHETICKGVANPLECHLCHKVFACASSKCKHLRKCRIVNAPVQLETNITTKHPRDTMCFSYHYMKYRNVWM